MKIAMVTSTFLPDYIGGRENHVYYLSKELISAGFKVCIFTNNPRGITQFEKYDGIPICRFPFYSFKFASNQENIPYRVTNPHNFLKRLRSYSPDVVHAHDYRHFTSDLSAIYCETNKKPLLLTVHGFYYNVGQLFNIFLMAYDKILGGFSLNTADKIICVSNMLAEQQALSNFRDKIVIIPNGVSDNNTKFSSEDYNNFKEKYGIRGKMILGVGRLSYQKGFKFLINAYKAIFKASNEYQLCIVGPEGGCGKELRTLAGDNNSIVFTGPISNRDLKLAYSSADLFVLSSLLEGCPLALLEAMSFGKPIVATSVGLIPEVIQNRINGLLVPPGDSECLAKTAQEVLSDDRLAKRIGANAKASATKLWKEFFHQTKGIYDSIA